MNSVTTCPEIDPHLTNENIFYYETKFNVESKLSSNNNSNNNNSNNNTKNEARATGIFVVKHKLQFLLHIIPKF